MVDVAAKMKSGIHFQLIVEGEVQLDRSLSRFKDAVQDISPFWPTAVTMLETATREQFASQGARSGDGWAPLSSRYAERKIAMVGSKPILQLHGGLIGSFRTHKKNKDTLEWGSHSAYGKMHQRGTKKMPQRKIVALTNEDRRNAMKALQLFIVRQIKAGS